MTNQDIWKEATTRQLAIALADVKTVSDMQNLLRDLMTETEITEMSARLEAARLLREGAKYTEIVESTKLSSRTIARISNWLKNGKNGYYIALDAIKAHHAHVSPASD